MFAFFNFLEKEILDVICPFFLWNTILQEGQADKLQKIYNKLELSWAKLSSNWNFKLVLLKLRIAAIDFKKYYCQHRLYSTQNHFKLH